MVEYWEIPRAESWVVLMAGCLAVHLGQKRAEKMAFSTAGYWVVLG